MFKQFILINEVWPLNTKQESSQKVAEIKISHIMLVSHTCQLSLDMSHDLVIDLKWVVKGFQDGRHYNYILYNIATMHTFH